jgi:hypothetical protein
LICATDLEDPQSWQLTKNSLDTLSLVRAVLKLRHIWQATYSPIYFRSSDSMYLGTNLPRITNLSQIEQMDDDDPIIIDG